jgi:hypothetical protein
MIYMDRILHGRYGGLYTPPHTPVESAGVRRSLPESAGVKFRNILV